MYLMLSNLYLLCDVGFQQLLLRLSRNAVSHVPRIRVIVSDLNAKFIAFTTFNELIVFEFV